MVEAEATIDLMMLAEPPVDAAGRSLNWGRWLVLASIFLGFVLFFVFGPSEKAVLQRSAEWRELARNNLTSAVVLFFAATVILVAVSAPVGIWLTVLSGFFFGTWAGTGIVNVAATLGAVLAFLSVRYIFAGAIRRYAVQYPRFERCVAAIDAGFRERGAYYVVLLRLTPIFPFFMVNLALGLTAVRLRDYWWASQLGMLPITLAVAHAGASLAEIDSFHQVLSLRVLGALCLLPVVPLALHQTLGSYAKRATPTQDSFSQLAGQIKTRLTRRSSLS